jgi:hypothetical protein
MPIAALATPGPLVTNTAPGAPVRSAVTAAMITDAVSCRASTNGRKLAFAPSIRSRLEPPPGTPKMRATPICRSASATTKAARVLASRAGATFIACPRKPRRYHAMAVRRSQCLPNDGDA